MFNIEQFLDLSKYATETHVARRKTNKKTGVKHFDICLMNPPYSGTLHLQFLDKVIGICDKVISIEPANWIKPLQYRKPTTEQKIF